MRYFAIILSLLFMTSCYTQKNMMITVEGEKNPTEYTFQVQMDSLKMYIKQCFSKWQYDNHSLYDSSFFRNEWLPTNAIITDNDFFLEKSSWHRPVYKSKVYFNKRGKAYAYFVRYYHLQLTETKNGVRVSVFAIKPQICTGRELLPNPAFLTRGYKYKDVPSTTVEEYEILLMIGKILGVKDMPIIKIPYKKVI